MRWLRKAAAGILPWPAKHERQAAIRGARAERERSQEGALEARQIERQIRRMAEENHFASLIAEQIMRGG